MTQDCRASRRFRQRPTASAARSLCTMPSISCISAAGTSWACRSSSARRCSSHWSQTSSVFSSMVTRRAMANSSSSTPASSDSRAWSPRTIDAPYALGNRGLWRKAKALNRQEFVVVGWSDPEGSRPHLGALLLGYFTDDGKLTYAGRVGTGMPVKVLADLRRRLDPIARKTSPLSVPPPRPTRFGSPTRQRSQGRSPRPPAPAQLLLFPNNDPRGMG
jgi:hypothetical protein